MRNEINDAKKWGKEGVFMKGYLVNDGYMGCVNGDYMLFASEADYKDYLSEEI